MEIVLIAAVAANRVIGKGDRLPWHLPADQRFLHEQIRDACLLTGRRSWASPQGQSLFPGRSGVIVLTRQTDYEAPGASLAHSVDEAIDLAQAQRACRLCVLGGGRVYEQTIHLATGLIITEVHQEFDGDAYFPAIDPAQWREVHRADYPADAENTTPYSFVLYRKQSP